MESLMVQNTPIFFAMAFILVGLLAWRIRRTQFMHLSWRVVGIGSALFWSVFAAILYWLAWDAYYQYYAPSWSKYVAPLAAAVYYFLVGLLLRWIALRMPGNPTIAFCLLGGLESIPEHIIAIYRFHILEIPLLQGTAPAGIFIFAFFEYVFYWGLALCVVILLDWAARKSTKVLTVG